jgi:hypothetical protein
MDANVTAVLRCNPVCSATFSRCVVALMLSVLALSVVGCRSPMEKMLAKEPRWERLAKFIASEPTFGSLDVKKEPFPDPKNPLHKEIWEALWQKGRVGDGCGSICDYYGSYLVTLSGFGCHFRWSYFYVPRYRAVLDGNESMAFNLFKGDMNATLTNALILVQHLAAVSGRESFIVNGPDDIPHTSFKEYNPDIRFEDWLLAKGITIKPPAFVKKNDESGFNSFSEYHIFLYMPLGGQLFRYEVRCRGGQIVEVRRFLMGDDIGDCWYIA